MFLYKNRCKGKKKKYFSLPLQPKFDKSIEKEHVKLNFQKRIVSSRATLPIVGGCALGLWYSMPVEHTSPLFSTSDYGFWHYLPAAVQQGDWALAVGLGFTALAVYMMVELNNANVLLRTSSRMLGSMLAFLSAWIGLAHTLQPGHVLMFATLLSFFPLFASYQQPQPALSFLVHLILSSASFVFPKFLWMVLIYWQIQAFFRAFSLRCLVASLLAILLPYWFYGGIAIMTGMLPAFWEHLRQVVDFHWADYSQLNIRHLLVFAFLFLLFLTGIINFALRQYLDSTRIRILFNALIFHGLMVVLFICLQPHYFVVLSLLLLVDTSILFGHFFALTHTRFSHIYCLILSVLALLVLAAQYMWHLLPLPNVLN